VGPGVLHGAAHQGLVTQPQQVRFEVVAVHAHQIEHAIDPRIEPDAPRLQPVQGTAELGLAIGVVGLAHAEDLGHPEEGVRHKRAPHVVVWFVLSATSENSFDIFKLKFAHISSLLFVGLTGLSLCCVAKRISSARVLDMSIL
jgi:hypothetical protein